MASHQLKWNDAGDDKKMKVEKENGTTKCVRDGLHIENRN